MSKKLHTFREQSTLIAFHVKVVLVESLENRMYMLSVFILTLTKYKYIVKIYQYTNISHVSKKLIHGALEVRWCIL